MQERIALAVTENTAIDNSNTGTKNTKASVIAELQTEGFLEPNEVTALQTADTIVIGDRTVDFSPLNAEEELKIGDEVTATGLATFKDGDNDIKWIYFGTDSSGKRLVTTQKAVPNGFTFNYTAKNWLTYEDDIKNACVTLYANNNGSVGTARSITISDINRVTGFTAPTFNKYTFIDGDTNKYNQKQVNYYYPSALGAGRDTTGGIPEYFVKAGETLNSKTVPTEKFDYDAYYYYKDSSDNNYKLAYEGNSWSATETNLVTLPDNMKYVVGESNELVYAVGSRSVRVDSSYAYFYVASVFGGGVFSNSSSFCDSDSGSARNYGGSNSVPVRPIVSLESSVKLTKVTE